ncbi:magnesium-translocating P-type ATPase [Dokdonella sp.]|uniref:magnesium-translocating P-type ATPase n=1 Tax=Dokdonella sp. TaxID=2291710 RepID=UPI002F42F634
MAFRGTRPGGRTSTTAARNARSPLGWLDRARTAQRAPQIAARRAAQSTADELRRRLEADAGGLSAAEAARRGGRYGPNEPVSTSRDGVWSSLIAQASNPLVLILLAAAAVSGYLRDLVGASLIALMVALGILLNTAIGARSQRAAARLRERVTPSATALRDGAWIDVPRSSLVPGDTIRLCAGDRVPADARIVSGRVHVQQAALTGESMPAEKRAVDGASGCTHDANAPQLVFLGTSVVAGSAEALVFATGRATAFGDVADALTQRPPPTEFELGLAAFARMIMQTVLFLLLFVLLVTLALGRPPLQSLMFALALAVGLTPEFMPVITTVTLARGAVRMASRNVIVKHLAAIEDFGSMTVLLSDKTGTLTTGEMSVVASTDPFGRASDATIRLAAVNSLFETGIRSALDAALLRDPRCAPAGHRKVDEVPFDFERRRSSVIVESAGERVIVVKGAPEAVVLQCSRIDDDARDRALDDESRARCTRAYESFGERGERVLAVARRRVEVQERYSPADETGLVLVGFVAFADPLVEGVAESLRSLAADGVVVKILTGDNASVARSVCTQAGIDVASAASGDALDDTSDVALGPLAEHANLFTRVSPAQKLRIVLALKARGHVVGFLGDGVNDAPSLHAADVGISVMNAVDVARDAADIVLGSRDLALLHEGVLQGRQAFANVMKYLMMETSSNFGNMLSMAAAAAFLPFLPMLPTQILLNNLLYDLSQTMIPSDHVDADQIRRPRRWNVAAIRRFMFVIGPVSTLYDFLTFFALLHWLHAGEALFHTGWFVESLATQTFVLFVIRTQRNPLRSLPSLPLAAAAFAVVAVALLLPLSPLADDLGFVPLPAAYYAFLAGATATYLGLVEGAKRLLAHFPDPMPA